MIKFEYHNLEGYLPEVVFRFKVGNKTYNNSLIDDIMPYFNPDRVPDWVKKTIRNGNYGEGIAWLYLNSSMSSYQEAKWVSLISDSEGYDISAMQSNNPQYIEVKTTTATSSAISFFMSRNEVFASVKFGNSYHIFLVIIQNDMAEGILIKNISKTINISHFNTDYQGIHTIASCERIKVTLQDKSPFMPFDLTDELSAIKKYEKEMISLQVI